MNTKVCNKKEYQQLETKREKQIKYYNTSIKDLKPLAVNDFVRIQPTEIGKKRWEVGKIIKTLPFRKYLIRSDGQIICRNRRHLRKVEEGQTKKDRRCYDFNWASSFNHQNENNQSSSSESSSNDQNDRNVTVQE